MAENQSIDVRVYYQSLSKKEKGKMLRYLSQRYDYPSSTMSGKLRKNGLPGSAQVSVWRCWVLSTRGSQEHGLGFAYYTSLRTILLQLRM